VKGLVVEEADSRVVGFGELESKAPKLRLFSSIRSGDGAALVHQYCVTSNTDLGTKSQTGFGSGKF
jgi:hypothetical protein